MGLFNFFNRKKKEDKTSSKSLTKDELDKLLLGTLDILCNENKTQEDAFKFLKEKGLHNDLVTAIMEKAVGLNDKYFNKTHEKITPDMSKDELSKFNWLINESILTFSLGVNFLMHYFNQKSIKNKQDPAWQNQGIFFWSIDEKFDNKSLPDDFLNYEEKYFMLNKLPEYIEIKSTRVIPWFGKEGGGTKHMFTYNNDAITIEEAFELKCLGYIEFIQLNQDNLSILQDRDNYIFIADNHLSFNDSLPYYKNKVTSLSELYHSGKLKIAKVL